MTVSNRTEHGMTAQAKLAGNARGFNECRLWAERDARQVVGGPVSEERLSQLRVSSSGVVQDLLDHIAFLERLLLDGDDLVAVRRTGYADGWRAGLEAGARLLEEHHRPK